MKTKLTELLGIKYPVIQGGMAWTSDANLAAGEGGMTDEGSVTDGADQAETGNIQSDQSDAGTGEAEVQ